MFQSIEGGRDYSQRPDFYIAYDEQYKEKALARSKPVVNFVEKNPASNKKIQKILNSNRIAMENARFLPIIHKQDWIAILNPAAAIIGFVPGDGFSVN